MKQPENIRHQMQIARRKNITKVTPSNKIYNRKKFRNN